MYPPPNLLRYCVFCISKFCVFFTFSPKKKAINCFFLTKRGRGNPRREPESGRQRQSQTPATYRAGQSPAGTAWDCRGDRTEDVRPPDSGKNRPGQGRERRPRPKAGEKQAGQARRGGAALCPGWVDHPGQS